MLKDWTVVQLLVSWDTFFQISGALNENALPTNEYGGMYALKEILAND